MCTRFYAVFRRFFRLFDISVHTERTRKWRRIRSFRPGPWRVQVRRKDRYIGETFLKRDDARRWAIETEGRIDRGDMPTHERAARLRTFGELVDMHIDDMRSVGRAPRRSKAATLKMLKARLGRTKLGQLDRQLFIAFGKERAKEGAGPMTLGIDIGAIKLVITHAIAVHGVTISAEPVNMARLALKRLGLVGKGRERDRRPTEEELTRLIGYFDANPRQTIPMGRIIRFAVATAMRQEEIFRVTWGDYTARTKMLTIRDRKDPREKVGNDQRIPLLKVSGYDPVEIIGAQGPIPSNPDLRIFPFNHRSAGSAFTRACKELGIVDLHFHDLRHEGTSRLFESGFQIPQVALVTGHKDWKMLRRYTHLRPESLHAVAAGFAA